MRPVFDQGPEDLPSGGQASPEDGLPILGHFMGVEDTLSFDDKALNYLNRGHARRYHLLSAILSNCKQVGDCLIWQGATSGEGRGGGYGRFSFEGRTSAVHRIVYQLVWGPISSRKQVDHSCCNRLCCNPDHLKHMTHKKNQKLRDKRSSQTRG